MKNTRPKTLNTVRRVQLVLEESRPFIFQGLFCLIKIHRLESFRTINAIYFHEPAFSIAKILPVGIKYPSVSR